MNIGNRIREKLREDGHSVTWFAAQICCTRTHVYKIFNSDSIDVSLLIRICKVLRHDFFAEISTELEDND